MDKKKMDERKRDLRGEDGKLGMDDIVILLLKNKEAKIDREGFLKEVLKGKSSEDDIENAISKSPTEAGIDIELLRTIADEIKNGMNDAASSKTAVKEAAAKLEESDKLAKNVASAAKSLTENKKLREAVRSIQKYMYLFGFPQIEFSDDGLIKGDERRFFISLCFAVMSNVKGSDDVLKAFAGMLPELKNAQLDIEAVKTKEVNEMLKEFRKKFLGYQALFKVTRHKPVVGKLIKDKTTKANLDPYFDRLRDALSDTTLTNPNHVPSEKEQEYAELCRNAIRVNG